MPFPTAHVYLLCHDVERLTLLISPDDLACIAYGLPERLLNVKFLGQVMFSIYGQKGTMIMQRALDQGPTVPYLDTTLASLDQAQPVTFYYRVFEYFTDVKATIIPSTELEPETSAASSSTGFSTFAQLSDTPLDTSRLELEELLGEFRDTRNEVTREQELFERLQQRDQGCRWTGRPQRGSGAAHFFKTCNPDVVSLSVILFYIWVLVDSMS